MKTTLGFLTRFAARPARTGARVIGLLSLLLMLGTIVILVQTSEVQAGQTCCAIVGFEPVNGIVTAKDRATGRTFQFKVADPRLFKALKIGQPVDADLKTMRASLRVTGFEPVNGITIINLK